MARMPGWLRRGVDERAATEPGDRHAEAVAHLVDGHPELAVPLLEQLVIGARTVFGVRHGPTLTVEGNLAVAYLCAERLDEGHALLMEVLQDPPARPRPRRPGHAHRGRLPRHRPPPARPQRGGGGVGQAGRGRPQPGVGPRARRHADLPHGPRPRLPRHGRRTRGPRAAGGRA